MSFFKRITGGDKAATPTAADPLLDSGVTHLENGEYPEAAKNFQGVLAKDPGYGSFEELDARIRQCSQKKGKLELPLSTRKAVLGLGIIHAMNHDFRSAEDYILDATYSSQDAGLLLIAGKYYLGIPDAELSTAFAYFQMAVEQQPEILGTCDELVQTFVKGRGVFYPAASLKPYLGLWDTTKEKLSKKAKGSAAGAGVDEFTARMLQVLEVLDIVGKNQLKKMF